MFLFTTSILIAGALASKSCTQNDMCGAGEKCYYGECILSDGPGNMCGGPSDDDVCFECFECNKGENACMPIPGCEPGICSEDEDCERGQICYNNDCALPDKIPGGCVGRDAACEGLDFFDCKRASCRWSEDYGEAGRGSQRKGGKGNRGSRGGGNLLLFAHAMGMSALSPFNVASLEVEEKGLSYDADGNIEYDDDGYAVLDEYAEMCGGRDADQECYECFECSKGGNRCVPISGCVPHCEVDDDCTREQICVDDEFVCRLPGGRPEGGYRDSSDNGAGQGAARKGGKGNRGDSSDSSSSWGGPARFAFEKETVVMKDSGIIAMETASSQNVDYMTLLWCTLAAVALLAVGALMHYLRASPKKVGASQRSRHMVVGDEIFF